MFVFNKASDDQKYQLMCLPDGATQPETWPYITFMEPDMWLPYCPPSGVWNFCDRMSLIAVLVNGNDVYNVSLSSAERRTHLNYFWWPWFVSSNLLCVLGLCMFVQNVCTWSLFLIFIALLTHYTHRWHVAPHRHPVAPLIKIKFASHRKLMVKTFKWDKYK